MALIAAPCLETGYRLGEESLPGRALDSTPSVTRVKQVPCSPRLKALSPLPFLGAWPLLTWACSLLGHAQFAAYSTYYIVCLT